MLTVQANKRPLQEDLRLDARQDPGQPPLAPARLRCISASVDVAVRVYVPLSQYWLPRLFDAATDRFDTANPRLIPDRNIDEFVSRN